jgi:hypothetical protein
LNEDDDDDLDDTDQTDEELKTNHLVLAQFDKVHKLLPCRKLWRRLPQRSPIFTAGNGLRRTWINSHLHDMTISVAGCCCKEQTVDCLVAMTLYVLIVRLWRLVFLGRRVIVYVVSLEECSNMSLLY